LGWPFSFEIGDEELGGLRGAGLPQTPTSSKWSILPVPCDFVNDVPHPKVRHRDGLRRELQIEPIGPAVGCVAGRLLRGIFFGE